VETVDAVWQFHVALAVVGGAAQLCVRRSRGRSGRIGEHLHIR
jgi:hypothetical protein